MDRPEFINRPVRLRFRFSEDEADALDDLARQKGISAAALIRTWLSTALHETNNSPDRAPTQRISHAYPNSARQQ